MERDMSSPMDATMSTRSAGQLVQQQKTLTSTVRAGPIQAMRQRYPKYLSGPGTKPATLAGLTIPGVGEISWKGLAFGMGAGVVAWMLLTKKKTKRVVEV